MTSALVLGIGNILLGDEGAGVHVITHLTRHHPLPDVTYLDGGTLSFTLAADIEAASALVVVDAAQMGLGPGQVRSFVGEDMDRFLGDNKRSVHEVGLTDLMDIARLTDHLPAHRALVGIQPATLGWGERPGSAVEAAISVAAAQVLDLLHAWRGAPQPA